MKPTTNKQSLVKRILWAALLPAGILMQGCMVGPEYVRPETQLPEKWNNIEDVQVTTDPNSLTQWWTTLDDATLNGLIEKAYAENRDVFEAYWRIQESRALRDVQTGQYSPRLDGVGSYTRSRDTKSGLVSYPSGSGPYPQSLYSGGLSASWELDLFGQISRSVESAQAGLEAQIANYNAVLVSLFADVTGNYVQLRTIQQRIVFAQENIERQRQTLQLTQDRFEAGISPELDVRQAELNLYNTRSEIPSLRQAEIVTINRIAVLINEYPSELVTQLQIKGAIPSVPESIAAMVPADVIRQRPDIRLAERGLAVQTAQVGIATADLYPALTLTGSFAIASRDVANLGDLSSRTYGFGPSFRWNLFSGNQIRSRIEAEKAQVQQSLAQYEKTVLAAVEEVENAMISYHEENIRLDELQRSYKASVRSVELVDSLYKNGLTDFQNVLDMQRTLFAQQDNLARSQGQVIQNLVSLYRSLGGSWGVHPNIDIEKD